MGERSPLVATEGPAALNRRAVTEVMAFLEEPVVYDFRHGRRVAVAPDSAVNTIPVMPAWRGVLTREDALDVIAYIKTLWTPYIRENCQGAKHMSCMAHRNNFV